MSTLYHGKSPVSPGRTIVVCPTVPNLRKLALKFSESGWIHKHDAPTTARPSTSSQSE
jgi:hypothetical protein